jgi:hypothetical protein
MISLIPSVEWLSTKYQLQSDAAIIIRKYAIAAEKRLCLTYGHLYTGSGTIAPLVVSHRATVKQLFNKGHELHMNMYVIVRNSDELIGFWDLQEGKAVFFDDTVHTISMLNMLRSVIDRIVELINDTDRSNCYSPQQGILH